jgi:hypothetical protein
VARFVSLAPYFIYEVTHRVYLCLVVLDWLFYAFISSCQVISISVSLETEIQKRSIIQEVAMSYKIWI